MEVDEVGEEENGVEDEEMRSEVRVDDVEEEKEESAAEDEEKKETDD